MDGTCINIEIHNNVITLLTLGIEKNLYLIDKKVNFSVKRFEKRIGIIKKDKFLFSDNSFFIKLYPSFGHIIVIFQLTFFKMVKNI